MTCQPCGDKGLIRICYDSGEPWDVAICTCPVGRRYRRGGPELVAARLHLAEEHRVALLEDFMGEDVATSMHPSPADVAQAGKVAKRIR